jgi:hypothetical protein
MNFRPFLLSLLSSAALSGVASAATIWTESVDGDLSSNAAAPTAVTFAMGSNVITGSVFTGTDSRDYITFTVQPGQALSALILLMYDDPDTGAANDGNTGYQAIILGSTSLVPTAENSLSFLGGSHVAPPIGTDFLPIMGSGSIAGSGFSGPLGPGTYSYHIQQTGPQVTAYSLDFVVVPEPSFGVLAIVGAGLVLRRRSRG